MTYTGNSVAVKRCTFGKSLKYPTAPKVRSNLRRGNTACVFKYLLMKLKVKEIQ